MESWRERGFVPDSDSEDGLDSQETITLNDGVEDTVADTGVAVSVRTEEAAIEPQDDVQHELQPHASQSTDIDRERPVTPQTDSDNASVKTEKHEQPLAASSKTADENDGSEEPLPGLPEDEETPRASVKTDDSRLPTQSSDTTTVSAPPTPPAKENDDIWDIPSSEGALQFDHRLSRKPNHVYSRTDHDSEPRQVEEDHNISAPSSPLSSLDSLRLDEGDQDGHEQPDEPTGDLIEQLLPPLDIPDEILRGMSPPARRSLRERKAIQLHPYMLEDAKYRTMMRAGGVKPVRVAQDEAARAAANESQGKEYVDNADTMGDSFGADFEFPPSSPAEPRHSAERRRSRNSPEPSQSHGSQELGHSPGGLLSRRPKRRKISRPHDDHRPQSRYLPQPSVVIVNSSPMHRNNLSTFRVPSPPRSEENVASSPAPEPSTVFRFPRGFTPPSISATPGLGQEINAPEEADPMDWSEAEADDGPDASNARSHSDTEDASEADNDHDEDSVRQLSRRIKGVLPASWLRLDQKQQEERPSATQRHRERVLSRTDNAKGVARKITKKADTMKAPGPNAQLTSLRQLADPDSSNESEGGNDGDTTTSRQLVASLGLEDSFNDYGPGDDIPEGNRIDYMFPPVHRATSSSKPRKPGKKRPTDEGNNDRPAHAPKRPRLKRQARLTDPGYGAHKQKRPTPRLPRIGILDAPDVASRPRSEQPQFLRVAARKARSRQDKGRRSPSRKVFNFSSRVDTEDANKSLHEWKIGRLQQTKLPQPRSQSKSQPQPRSQAKVARRQPLTALSTNRPVVFQGRVTRGTSGNRTNDGSPAPQAGEVSAVDEHASTDAHAPGQMAKAPTNISKLMQPEQRPNKWIVRRNLAISSLTRQDPRPAMLEVENPRGKPVSSLSFQRSLSLLNRDYRRKRLPEVRQGNLVLDRFISSRSSSPAPAGPKHTSTSQKLDHRLPGVQTEARRQLKKRPPKRLAVDAIQDQQPFAMELTEPELHRQQGDLAGDSPIGALHGFQPSYSIELNIAPLCTGTYFHQTTFFGSGDFSRSLNFLKRDLDRDAGHHPIRVGDRSYRWGVWNDAVSSELGTVFEKMIEWIERSDAGLENSEKDACNLYRPVVKYVTDALSFVDPIDRIGFVRRALSLVCKLNDTLTTSSAKAEREVELLAAICSYNTVFTYQILQIAGHDLVNDTIADEVLEVLNRTAKQAIRIVTTSLGQASIRRLFADIESPEKRDAGIQSGHSVAEAYVTVRHILCNTDKLKGRFQEFLAEAYSIHYGDMSSLTDVNQLERAWHCVLTTLPLDELDASGISRIGSRFWEAYGNWPIIKMLLRPVLDRYQVTSMTQPVSYYQYCRALFHRCFHLINGWGWRDCKQILDTLYDFFAKNTLYNLKHEEGYKSPAFLDELDRNPSLEVQPGDSCFHILLKIIASGLRYLSKIYDQKKTRNFAWRLLPNHGRVYPKEKPIHQEDLDALRNHHDLLCTLYYAVPDGCRPRLETIKNLVNPASSHRETCNISLRSWTRLVRFKLSTDEQVSGLEAFADWHGYFVSELLKQHALARQEVEAQNTADNKFSDQLVEKTIAQNQRQIESLLKSALSGLHGAIRSAPTLQHAHKLILGAPIKALLALFNPRVARVNMTVSDTLQVIVAYVQKCNISPAVEAASAPAAVDEDSQEYGDWADIAAAYDESPPTAPEVEYVERVFHPAAFRLISNCFGEDYCPEDAILLNVVECWTSIAQTLVKHGLRHWDSYLSPYNGDSWMSLRLTIQTRKFTPLFLASCIEKDPRFIVDCKVQVIGMWLSALVERVSMLKYQHRLTEALLNEESMDSLLQNLPFARDRKEGRYVITLEDLSHRRVSLISSILANMRAHLQVLEDIDARELSTTKQDYREIIQKMMSAMKANYQELGNGAASVQGAYVDFVHRIVGFLQQHSRDICPIDSFFTDPASFPLPSGDPTYIVARLKSYEPKLSSEKVAKTLIMFIQSVSERAAIDGQQDYLVNQLHASMTETYESGLPDKPTLRATLLQAVFPAYLEASFSNAACWILSRPLMQTITLVFQDLLFNVDTTDSACIASVWNIFNSVFQATHAVLLNVTNNVNMLKDPAVAISAASFIKMITAALPVIDYIDRAAEMDQRVLAQIHYFYHSILFVTSHLDQPSSTTDLYDLPQYPDAFNTGDPISSIATNPPFFHELRHSAARELQSYLNESWSRHQQKYYFTRRGGHQPQEINIQPSVAVELEQSPQQILGPVVQEFLDVMRGLDLLDGTESEHTFGLTLGVPNSDKVSTDVLYTLDLVDAIGY
ncbi:uncharacterized protein BO80DRAFT_417231 [Aspergillus ibericus CBS 121593]|uniref:Mus7/MMS22 family-domain-containing protein n=1 Tax=Aspergillus ibericus CBS 121593 TaxID=1448316 RepID=A0A395GL78_9EURO|nr:hypothetical protein BO80DRAFT_417231 [Aspergillus ibericus CBS 121593]RAK96265.1 hypothetical protein BO80DRAFT_417231 [Aspergillus ibericus CBS 121593]